MVTKKELVHECAYLKIVVGDLKEEIERLKKSESYYREMAELAMDTIDAREGK